MCANAQVGLDAAGKTTILYKLKLGEIVTTIPTVRCTDFWRALAASAAPRVMAAAAIHRLAGRHFWIEILGAPLLWLLVDRL